MADTLDEWLAAARAKRDAAWGARGPLDGAPYQAFRDAQAELLVAEREVAEARGQEHAVPLDFPVRWDIGAPMPHVVSSDNGSFLVFVTKSQPGEKHQPLALVKFNRCIAAKLGAPNDEVFDGHPLAGKGMDSYAAQEVRRSRWLADLQQMNSVHRQYRPEHWSKYKHYIFWFHDTTFECIAESFTVEIRDGDFADLCAEACRRLAGG